MHIGRKFNKNEDVQTGGILSRKQQSLNNSRNTSHAHRENSGVLQFTDFVVICSSLKSVLFKLVGVLPLKYFMRLLNCSLYEDHINVGKFFPKPKRIWLYCRGSVAYFVF